VTAPRTYCRVYHEIVDDPKFRRVYDDDAALATWLRMLLIADAMYPASAPMPATTPAVELLLRVKLIQRRPGNRYIVTGLERERAMRSQSARNAAAMRWHSDGNADAMPSRAEQSRTKTSKPGLHDGQHGATCVACFPPSKPRLVEPSA
jgi:hypothetical protein